MSEFEEALDAAMAQHMTTHIAGVRCNCGFTGTVMTLREVHQRAIQQAEQAGREDAYDQNCGLMHREDKCPDCQHTAPDHWQACPRDAAYWAELAAAQIIPHSALKEAERRGREAGLNRLRGFVESCAGYEYPISRILAFIDDERVRLEPADGNGGQ